MAETEKLNVDSIIGRLLEGIFRNAPISVKSDCAVNVLRYWYCLLFFYHQFVDQDLERMFNLPKQRSEDYVWNRERFFLVNQSF